MRVKDLTGYSFGRLTVLGLAGRRDNGTTIWKCQCSCGKTKNFFRPRLTNDKTQSCGCLRKEQLAKRNTKHGAAYSYTYKKWRSMWSRVRGPHTGKNKCYVGVSVCPEWNSYESFKEDMGECQSGYSLERIDNSKGYGPKNCKWIPIKQQASNTSRNKIVTLNGKTATISEHCRDYGVEPDLVFDRINKLRWDTEKAITTPKLRAPKCK